MSMMIKDGFIMREIAGNNVIIPIGERVIDFKGMMTPNKTGAFIWNKLSEEISYEQLLGSILDEYDVDAATAKEDLDQFLAEARRYGVLDV
jgi:hypothetical protein